MKPWSMPQSSEHWRACMPEVGCERDTSSRCPASRSPRTVSSGSSRLWITSPLVATSIVASEAVTSIAVTSIAHTSPSLRDVCATTSVSWAVQLHWTASSSPTSLLKGARVRESVSSPQSSTDSMVNTTLEPDSSRVVFAVRTSSWRLAGRHRRVETPANPDQRSVWTESMVKLWLCCSLRSQ